MIGTSIAAQMCAGVRDAQRFQIVVITSFDAKLKLVNFACVAMRRGPRPIWQSADSPFRRKLAWWGGCRRLSR